MKNNWHRQKIKRGFTVYYGISKAFNQYSICLLEHYKGKNWKMKIARRVTGIKEKAIAIFDMLRKSKVTICTFYDVLEDMLIC